MKFKFPIRNKTIYCIPNRFGFLMLLTFFVLISAGAVYSNNLVFMMGFLILSLIFTAILQSARTIRGLEVLSIKIEPSFANSMSRGRIMILNPSAHPRGNIEIRIPELDVNLIIENMTSLETISQEFLVKLPSKRGPHQISKVRLSTESPYDLFFAWLYILQNFDYFVYPQPKGRADLPLSPEKFGENFSEHRKYRLGDGYTRINWKIFAKRQELLVKEFKESSSKKIWFEQSKLQNLDLEDQLSQLSLWVQKANEIKAIYGMQLGSDVTPFSTGFQHYHNCLHQLGKYGL